MLSTPSSNGPAPAFVIRATAHRGNGVHAARVLAPSTPLLRTGPPAAAVILRSYRREVCAWCFAYDRGRAWPERAVELGVVFCAPACRARWRAWMGDVGELAVREVWRCAGLTGKKGGSEEEGEEGSGGRPGVEAIREAWAEVEGFAGKVREVRARGGNGDGDGDGDGVAGMTRAEKRVLRIAREVKPTPSVDALALLVSGILTHWWSEEGNGVQGVDRDGKAWSRLMALKQDDRPYAGKSQLDDYVNAYIVLLAILPMSLLPSLTSDNCHAILKSASHNAFSVRPSLASGSYNSEFLGWAVWPAASIWNHSCRPNVEKRREGPGWIFTVRQDGDAIAESEELCISYLGGEEAELSLKERRARLLDGWGFTCQCDLCSQPGAA